MDFRGFSSISVSMYFTRFWDQNVGRPLPPCAALWRPVPPNGSGLDPLYIKISDSGGLDLEAWCLDAWMLEGLEWIGGGDGGDGGIGMGGGDWKDVSHAQASGARRICMQLSFLSLSFSVLLLLLLLCFVFCVF